MKIAILSQKASLYSTRRLKEAGEQRGHEMHVVNYLRCYMNITPHKPTVIYQGTPLQDFDAIIPRIGASKAVWCGPSPPGTAQRSLTAGRDSRDADSVASSSSVRYSALIWAASASAT